jgi:mRNA interferase MazF
MSENAPAKLTIERFGIYLVDLGHATGSEMSKTRPCVVVSPDWLNDQMQTVVVAPMTTTRIRHPTRVPVRVENQKGDVVLHQVRTVDRLRVQKRLGTLDAVSAAALLDGLRGMFT